MDIDFINKMGSGEHINYGYIVLLEILNNTCDIK